MFVLKISKIKLNQLIEMLFFLSVLILGRKYTIAVFINSGLIIAWLLIIGRKQFLFNKVMGKTKIWLILILIICFGIRGFYKLGIVSGIVLMLQYLFLFIPFYMFSYNYYFSSEEIFAKHMKRQWAIFLILSVLQLLLYITSTEAYYARSMVGSVNPPSAFVADAYGLCQAASFIGIINLIFICKKRKKMLHIVSFIICTLVVILTQSVIFLIAYVTTILIYLYHINMRRILGIFSHNSALRKFLYIFCLVLTVFIVFIVIGRAGELLVDLGYALGADEVLGSRLIMLGNMFSTLHISGDLGARMTLYKTSIESFLQHPFLGVYEEHKVESTLVVGQHSELLDMFAQYGFFMGMGYFVYFFNLIKTEIKKFNAEGLIIVVINLIIMLLANPFGYRVAFYSLFYLAPGLYIMEKRKERRDYNR